MIRILTFLTNLVEHGGAWGLLGAFLWGIGSILLSPCHLSSIPLIIGFMNDQKKVTTRRAFLLSSVFSIGILITIALIGVITGLMGRMLGDLGNIGNYIMAGTFILIGIYLLDLFQLNLSFINTSNLSKKKGILAAFLLGLIFGIALGPCSFAFMAPLLAVTLNLSSQKLLLGILYILAYAIGHCSVIVLGGTSFEFVQGYLNWNSKSSAISIIKKICGILVILAGIYLIYKTI